MELKWDRKGLDKDERRSVEEERARNWLAVIQRPNYVRPQRHAATWALWSTPFCHCDS